MTKVTKIVGSLLAFSAIWLGGTAYTSANTEAYLAKYIKKTNTLYEANGMQISVKKFEKGFFTSDATVVIDFNNPEMKKLLEANIKLPLETEYKIENGPIFFKNGLGFGLSRVVNDINFNDYLVEDSAFKKSLKNEIVLNSITTVGFTKDATFEASSSEIGVNLDNAMMTIAPFHIDGVMNVEDLTTQMKMVTDAISIEHEGEFLKAKDVKMDMAIDKFFDNGFYLGNFKFKAGDISTKGLDLPFAFDKAKLNFDVEINQNADDTVNIAFKFNGDAGESKLPDDYAFLKFASVNYALKGMKLDGLLAFQDLTKKIQEKQADIMSRLISAETGEMDMKVFGELEAMQEETQNGMLSLIPSLLKKDSTAFTFDVNLEDKKHKKSTLAMNLGYVGDVNLSTDPKVLKETFSKELLNLVTLDMEVNLEKGYIANLPTTLQQELAGQLQMGAMMGIVKDNNSSFNFLAKVRPHSLMVNGEDRSAMLEMLTKSIPVSED